MQTPVLFSFSLLHRHKPCSYLVFWWRHSSGWCGVVLMIILILQSKGNILIFKYKKLRNWMEWISRHPFVLRGWVGVLCWSLLKYKLLLKLNDIIELKWETSQSWLKELAKSFLLLVYDCRGWAIEVENSLESNQIWNNNSVVGTWLSLNDYRFGCRYFNVNLQILCYLIEEGVDKLWSRKLTYNIRFERCCRDDRQTTWEFNN